MEAYPIRHPAQSWGPSVGSSLPSQSQVLPGPVSLTVAATSMCLRVPHASLVCPCVGRALPDLHKSVCLSVMLCLLWPHLFLKVLCNRFCLHLQKNSLLFFPSGLCSELLQGQEYPTGSLGSGILSFLCAAGSLSRVAHTHILQHLCLEAHSLCFKPVLTGVPLLGADLARTGPTAHSPLPLATLTAQICDSRALILFSPQILSRWAPLSQSPQPGPRSRNLIMDGVNLATMSCSM